jgi:cobalt transporter subunit CbtA
MLKRVLLTGLISGAVAGGALTLVHLTLVQPLIAKAEINEAKNNTPVARVSSSQVVGARNTHVSGHVSHPHEHNLHTHAEGQAVGTAQAEVEEKLGHTDLDHKASEHDHDAHSHDTGAWSPENGLERSLYTLVANILTSIAFGFLLASGFILRGGPISIIQGLLWGGAGFLSFSFLPGLGLPAELPGSVAGELFARQTWWLGTATLSVGGLALLAFGKSTVWRAGGLLLLFLPHVLGAPHPEAGMAGSSPPELASHFVMVSLLSAAVMWSVLGLTAVYVYRWLSQYKPLIIAEPHTP